MSLRVSIVQAVPAWENPGRSLEKARSFAGTAVSEGADIICFSEQFATGWDPSSTDFSEDDRGSICSAYSEIAAEFGIGVLGSFRERTEGLPKNTSVFFDEDGNILSKYSKIHLFSPAGEEKHFSPGSSPVVFDYRGVKFGTAICYDLRFPELFLSYKRLGAECILVPAAWPCSRLSHWDLFLRTRAVENRYYVVGINTTGKTPVDNYCGGSMAVSPLGYFIAGPKRGEVTLYADLDPGTIQNNSGPNSLSDRRDDLYKQWMKDTI